MGTPLDQEASSFFIPTAPGSHNASTLRPWNLTNLPESGAPPLKRPRISYGAPLNPPQNAPPASTMPPPPSLRTNPPPNPSNRGGGGGGGGGGVSSMFFKTRLCRNFGAGPCPYGNKCCFAHGAEELRQPPPNWRELVAEERTNGNEILHNDEICREFYNGGFCSHRDRCTCLHVGRESSGMMAMGSMAGPEQGGSGRGPCHLDGNWGLRSAGGCNASNKRPKKTICYQWETTGHCLLGARCLFAHGHAEIKKSEGHVKIDGGQIGAAPLKPLPDPSNDGLPMEAESTCMNQIQPKKDAFPKLAKKLNYIYADWINAPVPLKANLI